MKINKSIYNEYKHFLTLTIFLVLILWFVYLKKTIVPQHVMYSDLDSKIPFIKEFVLAYYFWFAYMALGFLYLGLNSKNDFYKMLIFLSLSMSLSFIIFIIYPNEQFPRPVVPGKDISSWLVNFIYNHDGTNNVFPSVHVCNSIGVYLALDNCSRLKNNYFFRILSFAIMLSISASTVLIKQHSIIDVGGGIALATILYLGIYQAPKLFPRKINLDI
ncbi:MAG: phosphatase PAP2 family protein [Clostridiaceae bacterium]|nr:phosphatase PAP2 family protein [Clostridiaceae bacterium]